MVVTHTVPLAPLPTTAVMVISLTIVTLVPAVPPKLTPVVPVKPLPLIVTVVPALPVTGVKPAIAGAEPAGTILLILPSPLLATYRLPNLSKAIPRGKDNPVLTKVDTTPAGLTLLMLLLL